MDTTKKKKRIRLLCIIAALLLIIGGVAALLINNFSSSTGNELSGEIQVSDEETLREALRSKKDCVITVTEDIVVSRELTVNGDKRLIGASIIMNLKRVGSAESVLAVSKGATLVLDGATVDGNGVVNCVSVKAGGRFESLSGSLIYGYPYGLDVSGTVDITNIKIDESLHTGINVAIFGDVNLRGGTISNNVYGIAVAEDASMNIADSVVMTNSYASFIINYGDMDIAGGKYDGAGDNAIENWGTLSIKGTADKPIEICNGTKSAINSKNNAKLTAEHIKIYDMGWHGMCVEKNSTASLKNVSIENAGKSTLYISSSKAQMEDVTVIGGAAYAVYATKNATVSMNHMTIKDTKHRGIMNEDSTLEAENLTITGTAQHGIYAKGSAVTKINNATITKPGVSAVAVAGGQATVTNTTIEDTVKEGISVGVLGEVKVTDVTIVRPGSFGVANYGGVAEVTNVNIGDSGKAGIKATSGSSLTVKQVSIRNAGAQAISVEGNSVAGIEGCTIDTTKQAAVYIDNSTVTMRSSTIDNAGTYAIAVRDSKKADGRKIHLDYIVINNPGEIGVGNINSYVLAGNITVNNSVKSGIYTQGEESITNMNQIEINNAGTCGFGFNGGQEITARNVTIVNSKNEGIYVKSGANVKKLDNVVIKDSGTHGIKVEGATVNITVDTKYNPENKEGNGVTILNPKSTGIRCVEGTITATGLTIRNTQGQGIDVEKESNVIIDGCKIDTTQKAAVYVHDSNFKLTNATIDNAGTVAISAKECKKADDKKVQLSHITIHTTGAQAIANSNSYVLPQYIKITNSKQAGIYTEGVDSITNMNQIEIIDSGTCGFGFKAGEITARNVTIVSPKNEGIIVQADANVKKLDNVIVKDPGSIGLTCQGGTTNVTVDTTYNPDNTNANGITIENPGTHGINISKGATVKVDGVTIVNAGDRGISSAGSLTIGKNGAAIDGTTGHGIYLTADASIKGTALTVKNAGDNGIFSEGAALDVSGLTIANTKNQGVQLKGGIVKLSDFIMKETGSAAVRVRNGANVTLTNGTVYAYNYGIATSDADSKAILTDVTIERASKDGAYKVSALVSVGSDSTVEMTATTLDGKYVAVSHAHEGRGVVVEDAGTFIMHSGTIKNNKAHASAEKGSGNGGGVLLKAGSTFVMNDGTIQNNIAANGAGVAMINGTNEAPVFTMNGGKIIGNKATTNGGGLALSNGVFTLNEGASITGNTAIKNGGGISMAGGKAEARPSFILNGGILTENTAAAGADMNCTGGSAKIKLQKPITSSICVKPNEYTAGRVMAEQSGDISDEAFAASMKMILVDPINGETWFTSGDGKLAKAVVLLNENTHYGSLEEVVAAANATAEADTITVLYDMTVANTIEVTEDVTIVSGKTGETLTLTSGKTVFKVAAGKTLNIKGTDSAKIAFVCTGADKDVLISNGTLKLEHVNVSGGQKGINIQAGGTLSASNIEVSGTAAQGIYLIGDGATGEVTNFVLKENGSAAVRVMDGAKVELTDGTIYAYNYGIATSGKSGTYSEATVTNVTVERASKGDAYKTSALVSVGTNSKLEVTGITLDGKYDAATHDHEGRGVVVEDAGTFIMHSGTIKNNKAHASAEEGSRNGGGVLLKAGSTFVMNGGTIQNNIADNGAGVAMINGTNEAPVFTMNGGTITGNHATTNGGGLALANGVFTLNEGASITGNSADQNGGGISMSGGTATARPSFILNGGTLTGNTAAGGADLNCTGGSAKIKLQKALTAPICVKPNTYSNDRVMAEKYGEISDADFTGSMKWIVVDHDNGELWLVAGTGKLAKAVATIGDTPYASLEAAIVAANATAEADTITVLDDVTVANTLEVTDNVTIVNGKTGEMLTITGSTTVFNVAEGKSLTINGTASAKIAVTVTATNKDVLVSDGTLNLNYVNVSGGKKGINIQDGGHLQADHIQVSGTSGQGIYFTGANATADISNFVLKETGSAAVRPMKGAKVNLTDGTIYANTYGVAVDGSSEAVLKNVTIERTGENNNALVNIDGTAKLEIAGTTVIDGKNAAAAGVNVAASGTTFTINGGTVTGANVVLADGAKISLKQALTAAVSLEPGAYSAGSVIVDNTGDLAEDVFASSMQQISVVPNDGEEWFVSDDGKLTKTAAILDGVHYASLDSALSAAADGSTIKLCQAETTISETISITKSLTITADKAVTITAGSSLSGDMVSVTGGTLKITGANADNKITFAASNTVNRIIWNNGGSTELTNVMLSGEATGAGIRNESGNVVARNVVISGIVKDGIHTKSGTTTTVDNVYINNAGEDGIDNYGTLIISNSANPSHALTIDTTTSNHGIDVRKNAAVKTSFTNVPADTKTLITICNTKIGIIIRGGSTESNLSYLYIHSTRAQGMHIGNDAVATVTVTNFKIENTAGNALEVKKTGTTVTLTNGTICKEIVKDANSTLNETNVTVEN